jgi:hypothetical protein
LRDVVCQNDSEKKMELTRFGGRFVT